MVAAVRGLATVFALLAVHALGWTDQPATGAAGYATPGDDWRLVPFDDKRPTDYEVVQDEERAVLQARSHASAAGLVTQMPVDPDADPPIQISWRWRVDRCFANDHERERSGDDFAARVFVLYGRDSPRTPWGWLRRRFVQSPFGDVVPKRAVSYVWASGSQLGEIYENPTYDNVSTFVVETGCGEGRWVRERRDLQVDFDRAFAETMPEVVGFAVMTDTDDTSNQALAAYADLTLHLRSGAQVPIPFILE